MSASTCEAPTAPQNGTIGDCENILTDESCVLTCKEGYTGSGLNVTCTGNTDSETSSIDVSGASCSGNFYLELIFQSNRIRQLVI